MPTTYKISEMAKLLGVSNQTLRNWDASGKLKTNKSPSGHRFYTHKQYLELAGKKEYVKTGEDIDVIRDKVVLITGGAGSLGQVLTRRLIDYAKKIIVYSRDEMKHAKMRQDFPQDNLRFIIGDIRDRNRLSFALQGVDICIHAAALKMVQSAYYNPSEVIETYVKGSIIVGEECIKAQVNKALFISSDKGCAPILPYGFSKAMAEICWINLNNLSNGKTSFMATRYGNVITSNGSFFHLIKNQVKNGIIELTDPKMSRFYMTLDQAVDLNLFALSNSLPGEIFTPKNICSATLLDFVKAFGENIPVKIVGIRGIEKIAEQLIADHEMQFTYDCGNYYKIIYPNISIPNQGWDANRPKEKPIKKFRFTSDSPDIKQLGGDELRNMVKQ